MKTTIIAKAKKTLRQSNMYIYMRVQMWTSVPVITVDAVLTPTASIQTEASTAAAGPVTMEMDFSALVTRPPLCNNCITLRN